MQNFRKLKIWEKALELSKKIYEVTESFPSQEKFGLTSQLRRASVSVGANIAEGSGRNTRKDFSHFLTVSIGSLSEIEFLLILSKELNFIEDTLAQEVTLQVQALRKMIYSFKQRLTTENR